MDFKISKFRNLENLKKSDADLVHDTMIGYGPKRIMMIGESGSGKTQKLQDLIPLLSFKKLIICAITFTQPIYNDMIKMFQEKSRELKVPFEYKRGASLEILEDLIKEQQKFKDEGKTPPSTLVIIDDYCDKRVLNNEKLVELFTLGRHLNINVIIILQDAFQCPVTIRRNLSDLCIFRCPGAEMNLFNYHLKNKPFDTMQDFMKVYDKVMEKPYSCLHVVLHDQTCPDQYKIRRNFNEFIRLPKYMHKWEEDLSERHLEWQQHK
jgi:hypothetical protein